MLSAKQEQKIKKLQEVCEEYDKVILKLNWDLLLNRGYVDNFDYFYYHDEALVGYLALYGLEGEIELCGMVHPKYRRKGIFTSLLDQATNILLESRHVLLNAPNGSKSAKKFMIKRSYPYQFSEYQMMWKATTFAPQKLVVTLEQSTMDDNSFIHYLDKVCFQCEQENTKIIPEEELQRIYLIIYEGKKVGKIKIYEDSNQIWLIAFCIEPSYQGRGIGKSALINVLTNKLNSEKEILLEVSADNEHVLRLYRSCGFEILQTQDYYTYNPK